jgi:hypothetical protein
MGPESLPPDVRQALEEVLAYNWDAEVVDARENGLEGHIFPSLVTLDNYLHGHNAKPEDYL